MEECPGSGAVPQTGLTGLQLPNHRAQGLWSASQFECGPATISGTGTRSVFGVLSYLVRAPARVPALWDWCQAFNSPRAEAPGQEGISAVAAVLRGLRAPWVSLQLSTRSSWGPCSALSLPSSHRKPDPLSPGAGREAGQCLASPAHPKLPASPSCARDGCSPKTLLCEIALSKLPEKMSFPVFPGISSSCFTNPTALTTSQILPSLCCSFLLNPFVAPVVH